MVDFINDVAKIINLGRYQMRIVSSVPDWTGEAGEHLIYISGTVRRLYWYDATNSTWQFMEWNSSGLAHATVVKTVQLTGQTGDIGATTLYTPTAAGLYRVSTYSVCTTAGGGGTLDVNIGWTDVEQAQTSKVVNALDLTGAGNAASNTLFISSEVAAITYAAAIAGKVGNPEYALNIVVERLF